MPPVGVGDLLQVHRPEQPELALGQAHVHGYVLPYPPPSHHSAYEASALLDPVVFHDPHPHAGARLLGCHTRYAPTPLRRCSAERSLTDNRSADRLCAPLAYYYSWAKASRNCLSCSSGRLVEMISKSYSLSSSMTLSGALAPLVRANSAEVPGVTCSRTCLMKSSSIPTSAIDPVSAPMLAPIAAPRKGTKKIRPNRKPQKAPPIAPAPAVLANWRVLGFLLPSGQVTTAASWRVINCRSCRPCRAMSTLSAPPGSLNFSTDSVAKCFSPFSVPIRFFPTAGHCSPSHI